MFSNDGDRINNLHNSNMKKLKLKEQDCIKCNKSILTKSQEIKFLASIHGKKSGDKDKIKKQKSATKEAEAAENAKNGAQEKTLSKTASKKKLKSKTSMPKKSMKNEEGCEEESNANNFSVTSSKKKFKEDLEGKFDMIIEAEDISENETEAKDKTAESKDPKEEILVEETQDVAVLKEKLETL